MVAFLDLGNNIIHSSIVSEGTVAQVGANYEPFEILEVTKEEEVIYYMDIEDEELELE